MIPYAHDTLQDPGEYYTELLISPHEHNTLRDPLDTTLDFSKVLILEHLLRGGQARLQSSRLLLSRLLVVGLLGLLHTWSFEGQLPFKGDLQSRRVRRQCYPGCMARGDKAGRSLWESTGR